MTSISLMDALAYAASLAIAALVAYLIHHAITHDIDVPLPPDESWGTREFTEKVIGCARDTDSDGDCGSRACVQAGRCLDPKVAVVIEDEPFVTFMDMLETGDALWSDIESFVDDWHTDPRSLPLHEFLGMPWDEYTTWAMTGHHPKRPGGAS